MTKETHQLTKKERSILKQKRREERNKQKNEENIQREKSSNKKALTKKILTWTIVLAILGTILYLFITSSTGEKRQPFSNSQIHWHADLKVFICGEEIKMPRPSANQHLGGPLLHTHDDGRIHVEGTVWNEEDITLNKYMKVIGKTFTNNELLDKANGDLCNGEKGTVKLYVDSEENQELGNYIIKDKERYELRFEPI